MAHQAKGVINRRKVLIKVIEAKGLMAADLNGKSDPFATLIIRNRGNLKQTSTKLKTLDPVWNEEFEFEIVDEVNDFIDINVYDWDKTGNNDHLGSAAIPIAAVTNLGRPLVQWYPLLDKFAASTTHSKQERGQIHVQIIYTDATGKTHSGATAATTATGAATTAQPVQQPHPMQQQMQPQQVPVQAGGFPVGGMMQPQMVQPQMYAQPQVVYAQQPMMQQPMMMAQPMMQQPMMQPMMMMPGQPMMMQPGMMYPQPGMQPGMYPPPGGY